MIASVRIRPLVLALSALAALAGSPAAVPAQEPANIDRLAPSDTLWEVRVRGGETYLGRVTQAAADRITLETEAATRVELARDRIESVRLAGGRMVNGTYWREDPNHTRLFFSPTARPIARGTGYLGVYELFIPFVGYGLTDRISLAGGSPFYVGLTGDVAPPFYFAPKVQVFDGGSVQGAVGGLALVVPDEGSEVAGIVYGVLSAGNSDNALTGGLGWGYVNSDFSARPVAMLGGETRVGRSVKLLSENVFVPGEEGVLLSGGVRIFGERLSADAGLVGFLGDGGFCCLPLVNVVWGFGDTD